MPLPTLCKPGTPEKIEVLRRRLEAGEELWHPNDAKRDAVLTDSTPLPVAAAGGNIRQRDGVRHEVRIQINGKRIHLGHFGTHSEAEAALAAARRIASKMSRKKRATART